MSRKMELPETNQDIYLAPPFLGTDTIFNFSSSKINGSSSNIALDIDPIDNPSLLD